MAARDLLQDVRWHSYASCSWLQLDSHASGGHPAVRALVLAGAGTLVLVRLLVRGVCTSVRLRLELRLRSCVKRVLMDRDRLTPFSSSFQSASKLDYVSHALDFIVR